MSKIIDEKYALFAQLMWAGNKLRTKTRDFFDEITVNQWLLLCTVNNFGGSPTLNDIASIMGNSHQNTKELINKLVKKGFLKVCADKQDKRKYKIYITEAFHGICAKYEEVQTRFIIKMYDGIDDSDVINCYGSIERILKNISDIK